MNFLPWLYYAVNCEYGYDLLLLYGLVHCLGMCMKAFKVHIACLLIKCPFVHVFKCFTSYVTILNRCGLY